MASYAVTARIDRVQPRLARRDGPRSSMDARALDDLRPEAIDPAPLAASRWERIRELWSQMTFYLFDADSWR